MALRQKHSKISFWMIHDKCLFSIWDREISRPLLFVAGTHTYTQISDPGILRHGTEVDVRAQFEAGFWTKL